MVVSLFKQAHKVLCTNESQNLWVNGLDTEYSVYRKNNLIILLTTFLFDMKVKRYNETIQSNVASLHYSIDCLDNSAKIFSHIDCLCACVHSK